MAIKKYYIKLLSTAKNKFKSNIIISAFLFFLFLFFSVNSSLLAQNSFPGTVTDFIYNAANQLVEVRNNGETIAKYVYDYKGRRVIKEAGGIKTFFVYDIFDNLIYEYNQTENKTKEYVYLGNERIARIDNDNPVIQTVAWFQQPKKRNNYAGYFLIGLIGFFAFGFVFRKEKRSIYWKSYLSLVILGVVGAIIFYSQEAKSTGQANDRIYFYHNDHLGTPQKMTDESGNVVWSADYMPFGEAKVDPSSTIENNFRFPGQYYDKETGLHYNLNRYYDPKIGYIQPDPLNISTLYLSDEKTINYGMNSDDINYFLENPQNQNVYNYVSNNPINNYDLLGLYHYKNPGTDTEPVGDQMSWVLLCMDECLKIDIGVSGGSECRNPHSVSKTGGHCAGKAADISKRMNPGLNSKKVMCCAKQCGAKEGHERSDHFHIQTHTDQGGGHGQLPDCGC